MAMHPTIQSVTDRIEKRSKNLRSDYLSRMRSAKNDGPARSGLSCSNIAHVSAAAEEDKQVLNFGAWPNFGIVTAFNDMLSAHQPFEHYPNIIKQAARDAVATAQVAGGVPAMCDGVTQGQPGMELSLFSREVIAMATAVSLSHDSFDGGIILGVCDKIVPGLFMGAAAFGHLPVIFCPAGPMPSGISNPEKAKIRQQYARGEIDRAALLEGESGSYHAPGTCTFYGTANSNQMMMEVMGLHAPCTAFVPPNTDLREALTRASVKRLTEVTTLKGNDYLPFAETIDVRSMVNAVVALMATGGSTNHTLHLIAMARAVGVILNWEDMADISAVTPLLTRIYPNGAADVNYFHAAGGISFVFRELIDAGFLHEDVNTVWGKGLRHYTKDPVLEGGNLIWRDAVLVSGNLDILRPASDPFMPEGGLKLLRGNLGEGVIKISAVNPEHRFVEAPARVFSTQEGLAEAVQSGDVTGDVVAVVRFQGPGANGMPELHKMTPFLANLQDQGHKVALVTDGRMSGASGKVPAAIHVCPGADEAGPLARVQDGDVIRLDAEKGELKVMIDEAEFAKRPIATHDNHASQFGMGRELFNLFRNNVGAANEGASVLYGDAPK